MPPRHGVRSGDDGRSEVLAGYIMVVKRPPPGCNRLMRRRGSPTPPVHLDRLVPWKCWILTYPVDSYKLYYTIDTKYWYQRASAKRAYGQSDSLAAGTARHGRRTA